jgi:hypothetical protein
MKILERADAPAHLFDISELDFSENLFAERVTHPWVRLGVLGPGHTDESGIEAELRLNTLLLEPGAFADAFGGLGAVGNDLWGVGQPGVASIGDETKYGECRTDEHDPKQYDTIADAAEATRFRVTFVCPAFPVLHSLARLAEVTALMGAVENQRTVSHRSHRPWKSLRDFHTPAARRLLRDI